MASRGTKTPPLSMSSRVILTLEAEHHRWALGGEERTQAEAGPFYLWGSRA